MVKISLTLILVFAGLFAQGCASTNADGIAPNTETVFQEQSEQENKTLFTNGAVNFKGVSFNYNPQIFGEVEAEEVEELPLGGEDYKPDSVRPQHIYFTIKGLNQNENQDQIRIYVFPIEEYRRMYVVSKSLTKQFDEELEGLKKVIKDKNYRKDRDQIPFLPFWDGSQTFRKKVKYGSLQNGKGIYFLTQFDIEVSLINNNALTYVFQGISSDEKNYILAKFPVRVPFLPDSIYESEFEGYKTPERGFIKTSQELRQYKKYISKITKRLENLPPNQFEPNLKYIEELISSLKVEK